MLALIFENVNPTVAFRSSRQALRLKYQSTKTYGSRRTNTGCTRRGLSREIGLICFQVSILPEKPENKGTTHPIKIQAAEKPQEKPKSPKGTEDFIALKEIVVPEAFLNSHPNPEKTQQVVNYVKQNGYLDEPLTINRETNLLTDGYRRYIVAQQLELEIVPVVYPKRNSSSQKLEKHTGILRGLRSLISTFTLRPYFFTG
ncbi:hypothetical protein [Peribacillus sp. NJ4]|uniref:hypothetical protein n=1 Tax=Peribacillus sp. NJ4 TaxID=3055862 RepID=UPI0025A1DD70|nr:hypothetical protein [Peribacillus sp. NJ4]